MDIKQELKTSFSPVQPLSPAVLDNYKLAIRATVEARGLTPAAAAAQLIDTGCFSDREFQCNIAQALTQVL